MRNYYRLHRKCVTKVSWVDRTNNSTRRKQFKRPIDGVWCAHDIGRRCAMSVFALNGRMYCSNLRDIANFMKYTVNLDVRIKFPSDNTMILIPANDNLNAIEFDRDNRVINGDPSKFHKFVLEWFRGEPV